MISNIQSLSKFLQFEFDTYLFKRPVQNSQYIDTKPLPIFSTKNVVY